MLWWKRYVSILKDKNLTIDTYKFPKRVTTIKNFNYENNKMFMIL